MASLTKFVQSPIRFICTRTHYSSPAARPDTLFVLSQIQRALHLKMFSCKALLAAGVSVVLMITPGKVISGDAEHASAAAADRRMALEPGPDGAAALARVLRGYHARGDGEGGFAFWLRLPFSIRARQVQIPEVRHWRYRVEFLRDAERTDPIACRFSGGAVLSDDFYSCDYRAELRRYLDCTGKQGLEDFQSDIDPDAALILERLEEQASACRANNGHKPIPK